MTDWEKVAYPHQISGAEYLAQAGRGLLGDDMGLGKTLTSLIWLDKRESKRILYTAPKEITSNLMSEIPKWVKDKPIFDLRGYKQNQRDTLFDIIRDFTEFIVVINLEAWRKDRSLLDKLISLRLDSVIVDEAHHLNNGSTLSYKGVREIVFAINQCPTCKMLIKPVYICKRSNCVDQGYRFPYRYCLTCGHIATKIVIPQCSVCGSDCNARSNDSRSVKSYLSMTGTPLLNKAHDLFWNLHLIAPSEFPTESIYLQRFCATSLKNENRFEWRDNAKEELVNAIRPYYLARNRKDAGIKLPPQTIEVREYDFDKVGYPDQWRAYQKLEKQFLLELEDKTVGVTEVVVQLLRLRQMLVWPNGIENVNIGRSFKMNIIQNLAEEFLEAGHRLVIFSHFKAPLKELQQRLGPDSVVYDGSTSAEMRDLIRKDFGPQGLHVGGPPRWQAVLCNYRSAGEGLNLVGATQAIMMDEEWSPGKNRQAYGRIDRIGQKLETGVHIPRITGTVDEWMADLNEFKAGIADGFSDAVNLHSRILKAVKDKK